jgi:hypothetical protein
MDTGSKNRMKILIIIINFNKIELKQNIGSVPRRLFFAAQQRIAITWKPN